MNFIEAIIQFFQSLFGGNKTEQKVEQKQADSNIYLDPSHIYDFIDKLIVDCQHLTEEETIDLKEQAATCCDLKFMKFVIHLKNRGEPSPYDAQSGNRYWHCEYLNRAKVIDIMNDSQGYSKQQAISKGLEPYFIENLLS